MTRQLHGLYMEVAKLMQTQSQDPRKKVGACIVDTRKNVIVSSGTNNFPDGCDGKFPWTNKGIDLDNKHFYVVHAEANAIIKRSGDIENCVLYSTLFPCNECAKLIVQAKIKNVIYLDDRPQLLIHQAAKKILDKAGIPYTALACLE